MCCVENGGWTITNFGKLGGCFELIHEHFLPIIEG